MGRMTATAIVASSCCLLSAMGTVCREPSEEVTPAPPPAGSGGGNGGLGSGGVEGGAGGRRADMWTTLLDRSRAQDRRAKRPNAGEQRAAANALGEEEQGQISSIVRQNILPFFLLSLSQRPRQPCSARRARCARPPPRRPLRAAEGSLSQLPWRWRARGTRAPCAWTSRAVTWRRERLLRLPKGLKADSRWLTPGDAAPQAARAG